MPTTVPPDLAAEFRRCLIELDVEGVRKLWQFTNPGLPQPEDDTAALYTLHVARIKSRSVPLNLRVYSQAWLDERAAEQKQRVANAVGVAVKYRFPSSLDTRDAMVEAVWDAHRAGVDLDTEASHVREMMMSARAKLRRFAGAIRGWRT